MLKHWGVLKRKGQLAPSIRPIQECTDNARQHHDDGEDSGTRRLICVRNPILSKFTQKSIFWNSLAWQVNEIIFVRSTCNILLSSRRGVCYHVAIAVQALLGGPASSLRQIRRDNQAGGGFWLWLDVCSRHQRNWRKPTIQGWWTQERARNAV